MAAQQGNKRHRTQVNAIEDDSEEEEQEDGEQAIVQLVNNNTSRQRKEKRAKTDQASAFDTTGFAAAMCRPHQQFGARAWHCLGNGNPLDSREDARFPDQERTPERTRTRRPSRQHHPDQHQRQHHPHFRLHNEGIELGRPTFLAQLHLRQGETANSRPGFPCRKQIGRKLCWKISDADSN